MASRSVSKGFSVMSVRGVRSALDRADLVLTGVEVVEILGNAAFSGTVRLASAAPTSGFSSGVDMMIVVKNSGGVGVVTP